MKAKKIVTKSSIKPQAEFDPRAKRRTPVYTSFAQARNGVESLSDFIVSKRQNKEAISYLFELIEIAKRKLLTLTGAPGVVFQSEIESLCRERNEWLDARQAGKGEFPANWAAASKILEQRFKEGWLAELGEYRAEFDARSGTFTFGQRRRRAPRPASAAPVNNSPRPAQPDTPTPAQLQAWFDLPSEPPQAEGLPAES
jgi:hypothetical protein